MKKRKQLQWDYIDPENDFDYISKVKQLEINHIFDRKEFEKENPGYDFMISNDEWKYDLPIKKRVHTFRFERDEKKIQAIYDRVKICRDWMQENLFD